MTVREVISVLTGAKEIYLAYSSAAIKFDSEDDLMMDAYGKYVAKEIKSLRQDEYEIHIAVKPIAVAEIGN